MTPALPVLMSPTVTPKRCAISGFDDPDDLPPQLHGNLLRIGALVAIACLVATAVWLGARGRAGDEAEAGEDVRGELQGIQWLGFALTEAVVFYGLIGGLLAYVLV